MPRWRKISLLEVLSTGRGNFAWTAFKTETTTCELWVWTDPLIEKWCPKTKGGKERVRRGLEGRGVREKEEKTGGEGSESKGRLWPWSEYITHLGEHLYSKTHWISFPPKVQGCHRCLLSSARHWFVTVWRPNWDRREGEPHAAELGSAHKLRKVFCLSFILRRT